MGIAQDYASIAVWRVISHHFEQLPIALMPCIHIVHAKNIWMSDTKSDTSRIFNANNIMLRVYTSQNNLHDAEAVFGENNAMVNSDAMQDTRRAYMDILDFYKNSAAYFGKKSDPKTAEEYNAKYNAYKNELQQHGYHLEGYWKYTHNVLYVNLNSSSLIPKSNHSPYIVE